jgi:myo-inositol-1(or 4)-monophosphatase
MVQSPEKAGMPRSGMERRDDLNLIADALQSAGEILRDFADREFVIRHKPGGSIVTEADIEVDRLLRSILLRPGEGWLSEEQAPSANRFEAGRVWIVDPLDGTDQFVARIPEWCVSIGLAESGVAVAGGIYNAASDEMILGAVGAGVTLNGHPASVSAAACLRDARVLASRSEYERGEWEPFEPAARIRPVGSIAYKMGLVAAGLADATWTLLPRNEWDVAAGAALVAAAGGTVRTPGWRPLRFNQPDTVIPGIVSCAPGLAEEIHTLLG